MGQGPLQRAVLAEQRDGRHQLAIDLGKVLLLGMRHVEQRAGISAGGGAARHRASFNCVV